MKQLDVDELEAGLEGILESPKNAGGVKMIVRRPDVEQREVIEEGELDIGQGLVGDNWSARGSAQTSDGSARPEMQLNLMNSRVISLVATSMGRWPLAGDQIYLDLDLSKENLPAGTQLEIGAAIIEVTDVPHLGCKKFVARFGLESMKFVNSRRGKKLCLCGINAKVVKAGAFRDGDSVRKVF